MRCFVTRFVLATGLCATAATAATAQTAAHCSSREAVVEKLNDKYGETRQSIGLGGNNTLVELFASIETGTWTITVTTPAGKTCLMASGQAFEALKETKIAGEDA